MRWQTKLALVLFFLPWWMYVGVPSAHATWSVTQHPAACQTGVATNCSITVTTTGANRLYTMAAESDLATTHISSITCTAGSESSFTFVQGPHIATNFSAEVWYLLASAGGCTTIKCTWNANPTANSWCAFREWATTNGAGGLVDTGATPSGTSSGSTKNPPGVTLTLSGASTVHIQMVGYANTISAITAGWTATFPAGNGEAYLITTSGTAPTWTGSTNNSAYATAAIAFKEAPAGVTCTALTTFTLLGTGCL